MNSLKMLTALFVIFCFSLRAADDQIVVRLATEHPLLPLYLANINPQGVNFEPSYLKELEEVLRFDLNVNGMTKVVKNSADKENVADQDRWQSSTALGLWKKDNVYYVVKPSIKGNKLSANILAVNSHSTFSSDELPLKGDLSQDRKVIHKLADAIHKMLFNSDGVASTRILYTVKTKGEGNQWIADIWESDYDGANARKITNEKTLIVSPVYIPPKPGYLSQNFLYVSYKNGQPKMFLTSTKGGPSSRLTTLRGNQLMPAISKQRDKIAFISDVTGNPDLFLQEFSPETGMIGKPRQIFAAPHATQGTPTFNPDGSRIAFVSNKDSIPRIYVMNVPSASVKNIADIKATLVTKQNRESTAPSWSPDGNKLAYTAMTNGTRQIWIYDFISKEERQLTQGPGHKENPTWAPDSLHLVFNSSTKEGCELYLVNLHQPEAYKITKGEGEKRFPAWEVR